MKCCCCAALLRFALANAPFRRQVQRHLLLPDQQVQMVQCKVRPPKRVQPDDAAPRAPGRPLASMGGWAARLTGLSGVAQALTRRWAKHKGKTKTDGHHRTD